LRTFTESGFENIAECPVPGDEPVTGFDP